MSAPLLLRRLTGGGVPAGPTLSYTTPTVAAKDLTALGYEDYRISASVSANTVFKAVGTAIPSKTYDNAAFTTGSNSPVLYSWTDGTPTASGSVSLHERVDPIVPANSSAVYWALPADTALRKVFLVVGSYAPDPPAGIKCRLKLSLSDASAAPLDIEIPAGLFTEVTTAYEVTFRAGSAAQTLEVRLETPAGSTVKNDFIVLAYNDP